MAKIAIILCAVLFAAAVNGGVIMDQLSKAQLKVIEVVEKAIDSIKSIVDAAKDKADKVTAQIKEKIETYKQQILNDVNSKVTKVQREIKELIGEVTEIDVSECGHFGAQLQATGELAITEMKQCFGQKRDTLAQSIENLIIVSETAKRNLTVYQSLAQDCLLEPDGITATLKALACTNAVLGKASLAAIKAIPPVSWAAVKLGYTVTTLPPTLSYCVGSSALSTFYYASSTVVESAKKCIQEKIEGLRPEGKYLALEDYDLTIF